MFHRYSVGQRGFPGIAAQPRNPTGEDRTSAGVQNPHIFKHGTPNQAHVWKLVVVSHSVIRGRCFIVVNTERGTAYNVFLCTPFAFFTKDPKQNTLGAYSLFGFDGL